MSQEYTITEAHQGRTYTGKHGDLVVWRVRLKDTNPTNGADAFELHKKPGNTPNPGDTIEVDRFSPGEHDGAPFVRIFAASQQSAGGGGSNASGGSGSSRHSDGPGLQWRSAPYERGAEHPRNEVRMIHTSSLSAAVPFINQLVAFGLVDAPKDEDAYWTLVGHVAGRLTKSYERPLRATEAPPQAQQTLNGGGSDVPADTRGMVPAAASGSDEDIPF